MTILLACSRARAADLQIVTPVEGAVFTAESTISVTVEATGTVLDSVLVTVGDAEVRGVVGASEVPPFVFSMTVPDQVGTLRIDARAEDQSGRVMVAERHIVVEATGNLVDVAPNKRDLLFTYIGQGKTLFLEGTYDDGSLQILGRTAGTTFAVESGTQSVISLTNDGEVTALGAGEDAVVMGYLDRTIRVPVSVLNVAGTATPGSTTSANVTPSGSSSATNTPALPTSTPTPTPHTQFLSGKTLNLSDSQRAEKRVLVVSSKDPTTNLGQGNGSADDPRTSGATLRVRTTGGCDPNPSPCDDTYQLPATGWALVGKPGQNKGYKYKDTKLVNGPIATAMIKPSKKGKTLSVVGKGATLGHRLAANPAPVDVVFIMGSSRYCLSFGGQTVFKIGKRSTKFTAKDAPTTNSCAP